MPQPLTILPDPPTPPTPVGLIAAGGRLPIIIAQGLKTRGHPVHAIGLAGQYDPALKKLCDSFADVGVLRVGTWGRRLRKKGVAHAIMVGRVDKARFMHNPAMMIRHLPDWRTAAVWFGKLRHDRRSHAVLAAIADELSRNGVHLIDSTSPIPDALADAGVMTARHPTAAQREDVRFAWPILAELLRLDVGQAVSVRDRDVIAVEAVEGTDRMIQRTGQLCRSAGWSLCKGARAGHDRRSDVPTVGPDTIRNLHAAGGRCLALAAGDVIMVDKAEMLAIADQLGVAVVGVPMAHAGATPQQAINRTSNETYDNNSNNAAETPAQNDEGQTFINTTKSAGMTRENFDELEIELELETEINNPLTTSKPNNKPSSGNPSQRSGFHHTHTGKA